MNHVGPNKENGSYFVQDEQNDKRTAEDGGRDDMFVDCPDEIENSESQQNSEEKDSLHGNQDNEPDSGVKIPQLIAEIEHLRDMHEKSETEKERITREYKEERQAVMSELAHHDFHLVTDRIQRRSGRICEAVYRRTFSLNLDVYDV